LPAPDAPIVTAGLRPDLFEQTGKFPFSRRVLIIILSAIVAGGLAFRITGLSAEGLSDDELNKYRAVQDYREHGLTSANGEHPMLMKGLITVSEVLADHWNSLGLVQSHPDSLQIPLEAAVRFPSALFGAFTPLLIFLVVAELFGADVALIAAALWAFDPSAIGFSRIAKEDTFVLFFFLLANVFWLRSQRVAELHPDRNPEPYYWATAAAFGAMVASKYLPHLIAISVCYNYAFQELPATRWRIGKRRFLIFFAIVGASFLLCNPAIMLPSTIRQMLSFAGLKLVGHDGYEFMGVLYPHTATSWLRGVPWYFYFTFLAVKVPLTTLVGILIGIPLLFRKKLGDGRFFILIWLFFWYLPFSTLGGKFTRYFTVGYAPTIITAAVGIHFLAWWLARQLTAFTGRKPLRGYFKTAVATLVVLASIGASLSITPFYRLFLNRISGGAHTGYFFPHDEFYDGSVREIMAEIASSAPSGARVATEVPALAEFYAGRAGRPDLVCVFLSDSDDLKSLRPGDYIVNARGRRYFSNTAMLSALSQSTKPTWSVALGDVPSADIYVLNLAAIDAINGVVR
jgi:hypothetical protein